MFLKIQNKSTFFQAIEQRDQATINKMLQENPALVTTPARLMNPLVFTLKPNFITPVQYAAQLGYNEIIELLRKKGADLGKCNNEGLSALSFAIINGQKDTVDYLLQYHGDKLSLEERNLHGFSALMTALWAEEIEMARHLLCYYPHGINLYDVSHAAFKQAMNVLWSSAPKKAETILRLYSTKSLVEDYAQGLTLLELLKEALWRTNESAKKQQLSTFSQQLEEVLKLKNTSPQKLSLEQILWMIHWPNVTSFVKSQNLKFRHLLFVQALEKSNIDALVKLILDGVISAREVIEYINQEKNAHYSQIGYFALALANNLEGQYLVAQNMLIFMPMISAYLAAKSIYSDSAKWLIANYRIACPASPEDPTIAYLNLAAPAPAFNHYQKMNILKSLSERDKDKQAIIQRFENDRLKRPTYRKKSNLF